MISEYECMLREGGGTTVAQEDWGTVFNATEGNNNLTLINSMTATPRGQRQLRPR